jgi:hypothetical protein
MVSQETIAHPAHKPTSRLERGWAIYSEHAAEIIASYSKGVWLIPSQTSPEGTSVYEVRLGRKGRADCECPDHEYHPERSGACKHQIAARYAAANSDFCSFCGQRFPYADLWELEDLAGFVCEGCA